MNDKDIFRIANIIHSQMEASSRNVLLTRCSNVGSLVSQMPQMLHKSKLLMEAGRRNKPGLFRKINRDFIELLKEFTSASSYYETNSSQHRQLKPAAFREIVEDIRHLADEFDTVEYSRNTATISVITGPIELEGINFGEFRINLMLENIHERRLDKMMEVVALTPHPAACSSEVTHPHVQNDRMCTGDGTVPLMQAIETGRILDFFMIAAQILNTYNPSSPYVTLDNWYGIECYNCGDMVSEGSTYYCECCGNDFCEDCTGYCECCEQTVCNNCTVTCECCDRRVCRECIRQCDCGKSICDECLTNRECECHENEDQEEADAEVQPVCVGEAHVHA